ncbi:MAG: NUDIX hydrolase [Pseudomonadota bacterium]
MPKDSNRPIQILGAGKYLQLVKRDHWEWAQRPSAHDAAVIIATDEQGNLILVEQYRYPLDARTIELPAGLIGDEPDHSGEETLAAARRELEEETGYQSDDWQILGRYASSAGMTSEAPVLVQARGCVKVGDGGGVDGEDITVHLLAPNNASSWLHDKRSNGYIIDVRVLVGMAMQHGFKL